MKDNHSGTVDGIKRACTVALEDVPEDINSRAGRLAMADVLTQKEPILKISNEKFNK